MNSILYIIILIHDYKAWCGHCKKLAPVWEELGELLLTDKAAKNVVIAKMDGTENDLPKGTSFQIAGFPTLKFFKADTNEIVDFGGDRTLEGLLAFVKETAKNGKKITAAPASSRMLFLYCTLFLYFRIY